MMLADARKWSKERAAQRQAEPKEPSEPTDLKKE